MLRSAVVGLFPASTGVPQGCTRSPPLFTTGDEVFSSSNQRSCDCVRQCWEEMGSVLPSSGTGYTDNIMDQTSDCH